MRKSIQRPLALLAVVVAGLAVTATVHADEPRNAAEVAAIAAAAVGSEQGDGGTSDSPQEMPLPEDGVPGVGQITPTMTLKTPTTTSGTISLSDGAKGVQVGLPAVLDRRPLSRPPA